MRVSKNWKILPFSSKEEETDLLPVLTFSLRLLLLLLLSLLLSSLLFKLLLTLTIVVMITMIKVMNEVIEKHLCPKSLESWSAINSENSIFSQGNDIENGTWKMWEELVVGNEMLRLLELHTRCMQLSGWFCTCVPSCSMHNWWLLHMQDTHSNNIYMKAAVHYLLVGRGLRRKGQKRDFNQWLPITSSS